jgi:hypothetical protein
MKSSVATVATENASRYLQQLCKHWGHSFTVTFNEQRGTIDFTDGQTVELAAAEKFLEITILDEKGKRISDLEKVVADHLLRFAHKEQLNIEWVAR